MVSERAAEEVLARSVVLCDKIERLGFGRVEGGLDGLAARVRNRSGHQSLELAGVVRAVAVQLALVDGAGQVPEDEPHGRVRPKRHADAEAVVEHSGDKRAFVRLAGLFFDDARKRQHAVPVAQGVPHGFARLLLQLVPQLEVRGDHLLQYGLFIRVDGEGVGLREQVAFEAVRFDAKGAGELRVLDQPVPAVLVQIRESLFQVGGNFPGGPTFGDGHLAHGVLAALDDGDDFVQLLVGGDFEPAGLERGRVDLAPDFEGEGVVPDSLFL